MKQLPPESLGNPADTLERPATDTDAADNGVPREEDYSDADTASGDDSEPPSADAVANGTKQQQKPIQLESTGSFGSYDNSCDSFFSDLDSEGASPKPPGNKFPSSTGRKLKSAKAPPPKCPSDTHTSRSTDTGEMHDGDGADASTAAKVDLTEPSKDTSQPTARSSADAEPANPSKGPPVPGNQAKTKVAPKAKHTAKSAPAQPGGDAAAMGGVGKLRYALKNLLDKGRAIMRKKPAAKAAQASPAGAIAKAARKCSPPSKAKAAGNPKPPNAASTPMPPATPFLEVHIQCRCTGLSVWTGAVEFELKWTRLDVRDCYEAPQQAHATQEPQSDPFADLDLVVLYRCKDSGEQLPLTLRLTSPLQRCTLYHAMLFNKHRGPFYVINRPGRARPAARPLHRRQGRIRQDMQAHGASESAWLAASSGCAAPSTRLDGGRPPRRSLTMDGVESKKEALKKLERERLRLLGQLDDLSQESAEHKLVLKTLEELPDDRRCYRIVGRVAVERTVAEVRPALSSYAQKQRESLRVLDARRARQRHQQPVDAHAQAAGRGHAVRDRVQELLVAGVSQPLQTAAVQLAQELQRVALLGAAVGYLHSPNVGLEDAAVGAAGGRQRRHLGRQLRDVDGVHNPILHLLLEKGTNQVSPRHAGQVRRVSPPFGQKRHQSLSIVLSDVYAGVDLNKVAHGLRLERRGGDPQPLCQGCHQFLHKPHHIPRVGQLLVHLHHRELW
ncbi:prefoldin subunit 2 [Babesia caballi]|uniref:Prefoldin subunit 2 n=1 Tax=Babesia caballi TaxID=5871 RepID=A0AAV4LZW0_BABCB|nr:prefoldin subunit 2 [Babesia caballi]